jgi:hypothetical protein
MISVIKDMKPKMWCRYKQRGDDSDNGKIEQFSKITAIWSLHKRLYSICESLIKEKGLGKVKHHTCKVKGTENAVKPKNN